jgi:hypothetical protein
MKQYVNYYGEETEKVPLPVAYHLEKGCGRINDTTRDGTICIAMDIKNARSKYFGEPSRLSQMVSTAKMGINFLIHKHFWKSFLKAEPASAMKAKEA